MKTLLKLIFLLLLACQPNEKQLSIEEKEAIKKEIITRAEKHAEDLLNLDYEAIMTFYADVDDHIIFGDGYYWGDYTTIDGIWRDFTGGVIFSNDEEPDLGKQSLDGGAGKFACLRSQPLAAAADRPKGRRSNADRPEGRQPSSATAAAHPKRIPSTMTSYQ